MLPQLWRRVAAALPRTGATAAAAPRLAPRARHLASKPGKRKLEWNDDMERAVLQQMRVVDRDAAFQRELGVGGAAALSLGDDDRRRVAVSEVDAGGFELNGDVFVPSAIACLSHSVRTPASGDGARRRRGWRGVRGDSSRLASRTFRGGESRRRRGGDVDSPWRRVAGRRRG